MSTRRARAAGVAAAALALLSGATTTGLGVALAQSGEFPPDAAEPPLTAVPRAACGAGSDPEPGMQGRVAAGDADALDGSRCNVEVVGRFGDSGGYKVERYVDSAGRECAYYDTTLLYPTNATSVLEQEPSGVAVLDMSDPSNPTLSRTLNTPAMETPHESLLVNQRRGLLAAVAGNPLFQAGQVDIYDLTEDCRNPQLRSSRPVGVLGHEAGFSPDGNTFWASSLGGGTLTAIDVSDPSNPVPVYVGNHDTHSVTISQDGTRAYLAAGAGFPRNEIGSPAEVNGLEILDVSQVQQRAATPEVSRVGAVEWASVTIPQAAIPVTIGGKPYVVEMDEFAYDGTRIAGNGERVGAARIIDISDETAPRVVSNIRLEVHDPAVRPSLEGDPGAASATGGYAGHYCAVPRREEPGILACSFLASGLRVFDIRDPLAPREVAYFVAPVDGQQANAAFASAAFAPERSEVWYSDGSRGFFALRLTNGAWPQAQPAPAPAGPPGAAPQPERRQLAATGLALPVSGALTVLLAALAVRVTRRRTG